MKRIKHQENNQLIELMLKSKNKVKTFCYDFFKYKQFDQSLDQQDQIRKKQSDQRSLDILFNQSIFQNFTRHSFYKSACLIKENILQHDDILSKKYHSFLVENRDIPMDASKCEICFLFNSEEDDKIVQCDNCNVSYHQRCYSANLVVDESCKYQCDRCIKLQKNEDSQCQFCNWPKGPLKKSKQHIWQLQDGNVLKDVTIDVMVHPYCVQLNPDLEQDQAQDNIQIRSSNIVSQNQRFRNTCMICNTNKGAVVRCNEPHCLIEQHVGCQLNVLRLDQKVTHEFQDNQKLKCPFNHVHKENVHIFENIIALRDKFVRNEIFDADIENYIKMEQAISWKGISELRKMKNSIELLHNCDDDDGWLHHKRKKLNFSINDGKNNKHINYREDSNENDHENEEEISKQNDDVTTAMTPNKEKQQGSLAETDVNSSLNTDKFHITSKRSKRKKCNSKDLKNVNNLPTKNLKEKMKKMITNNIKYDKLNDKEDKMTQKYVNKDLLRQRSNSKGKGKDADSNLNSNDKLDKDSKIFSKNKQKENQTTKLFKKVKNKKFYDNNINEILNSKNNENIQNGIINEDRKSKSDQILDFSNVGNDTNLTDKIDGYMNDSYNKNNSRGKNKKAVNITHNRSTQPKIINLEKSINKDEKTSTIVNNPYEQKIKPGRKKGYNKIKIVEIDNDQIAADNQNENKIINEEQIIINSVKKNIEVECKNNKNTQESIINNEINKNSQYKISNTQVNSQSQKQSQLSQQNYFNAPQEHQMNTRLSQQIKKANEESESIKPFKKDDKKKNFINLSKSSDMEQVFGKIKYLLSLNINEDNQLDYKTNINQSLVLAQELLVQNHKTECQYKQKGFFKALQNLRSKFKGLKDIKNLSSHTQKQTHESINLSINVNLNYNDTEISKTRNIISENENNSNLINKNTSNNNDQNDIQKQITEHDNKLNDSIIKPKILIKEKVPINNSIDRFETSNATIAENNNMYFERQNEDQTDHIKYSNSNFQFSKNNTDNQNYKDESGMNSIDLKRKRL